MAIYDIGLFRNYLKKKSLGPMIIGEKKGLPAFIAFGFLIVPKFIKDILRTVELVEVIQSGREVMSLDIVLYYVFSLLLYATYILTFAISGVEVREKGLYTYKKVITWNEVIKCEYYDYRTTNEFYEGGLCKVAFWYDKEIRFGKETHRVIAIEKPLSKMQGIEEFLANKGIVPNESYNTQLYL